MLSLLSSLFDFIYPPLCLSCGCLMSDGSQKLCRECWDAIPRLSPGEELVLNTRKKLLAEGEIDDLVALFLFEKGGPFQHIAHAVKYRSYESLARALGRLFGDALLQGGERFDAIVPVPLHRVKHRERGYNQAELIARGASEVIGIPVLRDVVMRVRHTRTQTKLSHDERRKNMAEAFVPSGHVSLAGARVLLVDDVITTGATTSACAKAIRTAGASRIVAGAIALAHKDSDSLP